MHKNDDPSLRVTTHVFGKLQQLMKDFWTGVVPGQYHNQIAKSSDIINIPCFKFW